MTEKIILAHKKHPAWAHFGTKRDAWLWKGLETNERRKRDVKLTSKNKRFLDNLGRALLSFSLYLLFLRAEWVIASEPPGVILMSRNANKPVRLGRNGAFLRLIFKRGACWRICGRAVNETSGVSSPALLRMFKYNRASTFSTDVKKIKCSH